MIQQATARARAREEVRLRELGIYTLPDGGEYVASSFYSGVCCLYTPPSWELFAGDELRVDTGGGLLKRGSPTRWNVYDLRDTGRTARYPTPVIG
ncbi:MAG TPA: hypothetical protein VFZ44_02975 [Pyrinomonadaceae bacterium]